MADNQRDPIATTPRKNPTDDDLNREDITPGESDTERERGYDETRKGETKPTDPDSAFSDVDRDDTIDD